MFGRETCHACNDKKTRRRDAQDRPICGDCEYRLEIDAKMAGEKQLTCPVDGQPMKKELLEGIIIDRCGSCNAVLLEGSELEELQDVLADSGRTSGFGTGLAVGMVIN